MAEKKTTGVNLESLLKMLAMANQQNDLDEVCFKLTI